jgi:hypothetical protein
MTHNNKYSNLKTNKYKQYKENKENKKIKENKENKTTKENKEKKTKQKRVSFKNEINTKPQNKNNFPNGEKHKCISPCYKSNTLYYHPLTLQSIKKNFDSCAIQKNKNNEYIDKCIYDANYNFANYDLFADFFQVASTDDDFLRQIYSINNIEDVENFLNNDINTLSILSQIRIINCIFNVYCDYDIFPTDIFIKTIKYIIKKKYDIKLKSNNIIDLIMSVKYTTKKNNIIDLLINKNLDI